MKAHEKESAITNHTELMNFAQCCREVAESDFHLNANITEDGAPLIKGGGGRKWGWGRVQRVTGKGENRRKGGGGGETHQTECKLQSGQV